MSYHLLEQLRRNTVDKEYLYRTGSYPPSENYTEVRNFIVEKLQKGESKIKVMQRSPKQDPLIWSNYKIFERTGSSIDWRFAERGDHTS
jgi:hypothetical protein